MGRTLAVLSCPADAHCHCCASSQVPPCVPDFRRAFQLCGTPPSPKPVLYYLRIASSKSPENCRIPEGRSDLHSPTTGTGIQLSHKHSWREHRTGVSTGRRELTDEQPWARNAKPAAIKPQWASGSPREFFKLQNPGP